MATGAHPAYIAGTCLDLYQIVTQALEHLFSLLRTGRADGHDANDCGAMPTVIPIADSALRILFRPRARTDSRLKRLDKTSLMSFAIRRTG